MAAAATGTGSVVVAASLPCGVKVGAKELGPAPDATPAMALAISAAWKKGGVVGEAWSATAASAAAAAACL